MEGIKTMARELDREGFEFAFVMDQIKEERARGITIGLAHKKLITDNLITLKSESKPETVTFHDPCYLGRYEGDFTTTRDLISKSGYNLVEMERNRDKAICCGGGSAGFVREQKVEKRVDQTRKEHVRNSGANLLVTACPECKMMLNAAVEETRDIAQVIAEALD